MITSINEFHKYVENTQLKAFDTSVTADDVDKFRTNLKQYFHNGFNIKAIKDAGILNRLVIDDYDKGVIIDYNNVDDGSKTGILYSGVFKKIYPDIGLKCVGWQNHTIGSIRQIIQFMFNKIHPEYNIIIDDMTFRNDNKIIVSMK